MGYLVQVTPVHCRAYTSDRFDFYKRQASESSGTLERRSKCMDRQSTRKFPRQNVKGGLAERFSNSLSGLPERLLRIPHSSGDGRESRNSWKRSDRTNRQLNRETVPPTEIEIYRVFPCVRLRLVHSSKANETGRNWINSFYQNFR